MSLVSLGVVWGGYTLIWYGLTLLRGPGLGIGDLVRPSQIAKCQAWWSTPAGSGSLSASQATQNDINKGTLHAGPPGGNDIAPGPTLGVSPPASNGQIGVNPITGQPIFQS